MITSTEKYKKYKKYKINKHINITKMGKKEKKRYFTNHFATNGKNQKP